MPAQQPTTSTNPGPPRQLTTDDNYIPGPRKRQARIDDNGEPVSFPASKKMKSAETNGEKEKVPTKSSKTRPQKKKTAPKTAPAKRKPSASIEIDSDDNLNDSDLEDTPKVADGSDAVVDEDPDVVDVPEIPEEDDEAELGPYLLSNRIVSS
jgi:hypothetical protein